VVVVAALVAAGAALTVSDLAARTGSPVGAQEFAPLETALHAPRAVPVGALARVFVSSAIWPGAQHGDAMTPVAMLLYVTPLLALLVFGLSASWSGRTRRALARAAFGLAVFSAAQSIHAYGFLRQAWARDLAMPAGGAEGWYLWSLAPVFVPVVGHAIRGLGRRPLALGLFVLWCLGADVATHEGALFRDYAGATSPSHRGVLFRWGTDASRPEGSLGAVGAGRPSAAALVSLRASNVVTTLLVAAWALRRARTRSKQGRKPGLYILPWRSQ